MNDTLILTVKGILILIGFYGFFLILAFLLMKYVKKHLDKMSKEDYKKFQEFYRKEKDKGF